eukprot:84948-Amphidinium_carterae.1
MRRYPAHKLSLVSFWTGEDDERRDDDGAKSTGGFESIPPEDSRPPGRQSSAQDVPMGPPGDDDDFRHFPPFSPDSDIPPPQSGPDGSVQMQQG